MPLEKRIPLSKETWEELGEMKKSGQTYDKLIKKIIQEARKYELAEKARKAREGKGKWIKLKDVNQ